MIVIRSLNLKYVYIRNMLVVGKFQEKKLTFNPITQRKPLLIVCGGIFLFICIFFNLS